MLYNSLSTQSGKINAHPLPLHATASQDVENTLLADLKKGMAGCSESRARYAAGRELTFASMPKWLQDKAFDIAASDLNCIGRDAMLTHILSKFASSAGIAAIKSSIVAGSVYFKCAPGRENFKQRFLRCADKNLNLTTSRFNTLGLDSFKRLSDLLEQIHTPAAVTETKLPFSLQLQNNAKSKELYKFITQKDTSVPYNPSRPGIMGEAARKSFDTIRSLILAYCIIADKFASYNLSPLHHSVTSLVDEIKDKPWEKAAASRRLMMLDQYAEFLTSFTLKALPHSQAMLEFGLQLKPISEMLKHDNNLHEQSNHTNGHVNDTADGINGNTITTQVNPAVQELRNAIRPFFSHLKVEDANRTVRVIAKLCYSGKVSKEEITARLNAAPDKAKLVRALRAECSKECTIEKPSARPAAKETKALDLNQPSLVKLPVSPLTVYVGHMKGASPFNRWFNSLLPDMQAKVENLIKHVAAGYDRKVSKLYRHKLYEIRDLSTGSGLRIYFTYIGAGSMILFSGGDKDSQDRNIKACYPLVEKYSHLDEKMLPGLDLKIFPLE